MYFFLILNTTAGSNTILLMGKWSSKSFFSPKQHWVEGLRLYLKMPLGNTLPAPSLIPPWVRRLSLHQTAADSDHLQSGQTWFSNAKTDTWLLLSECSPFSVLRNKQKPKVPSKTEAYSISLNQSRLWNTRKGRTDLVLRVHCASLSRGPENSTETACWYSFRKQQYRDGIE